MTAYPGIAVETKWYYPEHIGRIREFQEIAACYDKMLCKMWVAMGQIYRNQFFDTMDDDGCRMHEDMLQIHVRPDDGLDDRRGRIKGYYASDLPYVERKFNDVLAIMCGSGGYELEIDKQAKTVTVHVKLAAVNIVSNVYELVRGMSPATMQVSVDIIYNVYIRFRRMTHGEMGQYTHDDLRNNKIFQQEETG